MQSSAVRVMPASRRRLAWGALFAAALAAALAIDPGAWQLWALLVAPDVALLVGTGRDLEKGQLHPRAVPLYNALHHPAGPAVLAVASIWLGEVWLVGALAWLAHIAIDRALGYGRRDARGFVAKHAG
jgi:Domain of unknown function (DUF4260)